MGTMNHEHRRKDGTIRRCDLDFAHLIGAVPILHSLLWCNHGKLDPDIGYCISACTIKNEGLRIGTPCDDPFLARRRKHE